MAAEMDNAGSQELAQFWKEVPKTKIMEHRYTSVFFIYHVSKCVKELVHTWYDRWPLSCETELAAYPPDGPMAHLHCNFHTDCAVMFWRVSNQH